MTPDERKMLNDLADRIAQTPAPPKDQEAEDFIRTRIGSRPDALYLMTQTVLIQNLALQHAQQQIQELQQRANQPAPAPGGSSSFLGQGQQPPRTAPSWSGQQGPAQPPPPQYMPLTPTPPSPSGAPSFLRGAAQTAAGVAAGALAFEGIQSLFSHPGYGGGGLFGGGGGGFFGGGGGMPVEETVVNNYYDNPSGGDYQAADYQGGDQGDNYQDASDDGGQMDDSGQYDDASYDSGDDSGGFDDSSGGSDFA